MKTIHLGLVATAAALAAVTSGCGKGEKPHEPTEAEIFGYKGEDLAEPTNQTFLVTGAAVTNWLPERVLSVVEKYDLSADEEAVVKAAGALMPGQTYTEFPSDFVKESEEPWFTWWTKPVTGFGLEGKTGILSHYDEDKKIWDTNESYFSCYWETQAEAEAALTKVREQLDTTYHAKKFHDVTGGWVAEYVRLCVMGVVGQKADGTWSCMIDLRDKCNLGCGPWESIADQQERRDQYVYLKALKAWKVAMKEVLEKNHELVAKAAQEKLLPGFPEASEPLDAGNGRTVRILNGATNPVETTDAAKEALAALWTERVAALTAALGVTAQSEMAEQEEEGMGTMRMQTFTNALYEARLDAFMPVPTLPPVEAETADGEAKKPAEGESSTEAPAARPQAVGQWRIIFGEAIQPGIVLPERPQLKK